MFEKDVRKITYGHKIDRENLKDEKLPANVFYRDGHINELFRIYMLGYALAKNLYGKSE